MATPKKAPERRMLTVDGAIANAEYDLKTDYVDDVFPDADGNTYSVKIRTLTAANQTSIKQAAIKTGRGDTTVIWRDMERMQFKMGVVEPKFSDEQVKMLHIKSGPSFAKVIAALDELSGIDKEALRKAQEDFRESDGE